MISLTLSFILRTQCIAHITYKYVLTIYVFRKALSQQATSRQIWGESKLCMDFVLHWGLHPQTSMLFKGHLCNIYKNHVHPYMEDGSKFQEVY